MLSIITNNNFKNNLTIISGGQSGVDRAALDFAITYGISCGGFCPKGRLAEDGVIHIKYPLQETNSSLYEERTVKNVDISDALLLILDDELDVGSELALSTARKLSKPVLIINLKSPRPIKEIKFWINKNMPCRINFAGPRESNSPGIYDNTYAYLEELIHN